MNTPATEMPPLVPLGQMIEARHTQRTAADRVLVSFQVTDDWLQGRTSFGGLIAALGVQAMRDVAETAWPAEVSLRALQTSFVGPVAAGPVVVEALLLREGKSVRQVQATVRQGGQVTAVMLGVFASDRTSSLAPVHPHRPPGSHAPGSLPARPYLPGAPQFLRHFDLRWDHGPMPGSGGSGLHTRIHMRMQRPEGLSDELITVMLADTSPTPATGQFSQPSPASSVSWALEVQALRLPVAADGWWRADNESVVIAGGYVNHAARLWAPSGELAALAYQVVTVYG